MIVKSGWNLKVASSYIWAFTARPRRETALCGPPGTSLNPCLPSDGNTRTIGRYDCSLTLATFSLKSWTISTRAALTDLLSPRITKIYQYPLPSWTQFDLTQLEQKHASIFWIVPEANLSWRRSDPSRSLKILSKMARDCWHTASSQIFDVYSHPIVNGESSCVSIFNALCLANIHRLFPFRTGTVVISLEIF
jgi:hypothetical protein